MSSLPEKPIPVYSSNKKIKKIARLVVDRDLCVGAASCVVVYPSVFQLDDENKAVIRIKDGKYTSGPVNRVDVDVMDINDDDLLLAAQACPTLAIFLYDEEGNQIYPENI